MWFGILGSTRVLAADGTALSVGGPRLRALLALLLLDAGAVVSIDRLIDGLYGADPPRAAGNALQAQVSRLRGRLGADLIQRCPTGYRLDVDRGHVDVHRFTDLAGRGRAALAAGESATAVALLDEALNLWVDPADVPEPRAVRLTEVWLDAVEDRAEAELARRGDPRELVGRLRPVVASHPLRERLRGLLMRALHASGRRADALAAFEDVRRTLTDELGADPSPELAATHLAILAAEPVREQGIPAQLTRFVGREEELHRVRELLRTARLVTLTGPGGVGKTRLAIEASPHPACFVDLAPLAEESEVPRAVLTALGLHETRSLSAPADEPDPVQRLVRALHERQLLLILDNCEHLVTATATLVHRLLAACPGLHVLATSREPFAITGETLYPLSPLPADRAVRLFADRAEAVSSEFAMGDAAIRICRVLDGLPLAIELAAARLRALTVPELEARLDDRFGLLSRGDRTAAPRHRTLHAVVDWSWSLLDAGEQRLLRRLAVFAGGATADAVASVLGEADADDLLQGLVDKSLLEVSSGRYRMLDTIREFSAGRLAEAGERERFARAHAEYFLQLAQTADPYLRGGEQLAWLDRLTAEHANLHCALRWAVRAEPRLALELIGSLTSYWRLRGGRSEVAPLAAQLLDGLEAPDGLEEEYVLTVLGTLPTPPAGALERAEAIMRTRTWPLRQPYLLVAWSLFTGPPEPGTPLPPLYEQFVAARDPWCRALVHFSLSYQRIFSGDLTDAETEFARSLEWFRSVGDRWGVAQVLDGLATIADGQGDWERALARTDEAIEQMTQLRAVEEIAELSCRRASLLLRSGDLDAADTGYRQAEELAIRTGVPATLAMMHHGRGRLACHRGDRAEARHRYDLALDACGPDWQSLGVRSHVRVSLALLDEDGERAAYLLGIAVALGDPARDPEHVEETRRLIGDRTYEAEFARGAATSREAAATVLSAA